MAESDTPTETVSTATTEPVSVPTPAADPPPAAAATPPKSTGGKTRSRSTRSSGGKAGLHDAQAKPVKVGDYPERSYKDAMTRDQRDALKEAGLL